MFVLLFCSGSCSMDMTLFYVIPVCLSHLSLDKLFFFLELVDITLMVEFFLSFIHPISPFNHMLYFLCYPREFVLSIGNLIFWGIWLFMLSSRVLVKVSHNWFTSVPTTTLCCIVARSILMSVFILSPLPSYIEEYFVMVRNAWYDVSSKNFWRNVIDK